MIYKEFPAKKQAHIHMYVQALKSYNTINKELIKTNKMLEDIGGELLKSQVRRNTSDEFRKIIKLLETKISEFRVQIQVKEVNFLEAK